jgi:hypothetical protein
MQQPRSPKIDFGAILGVVLFSSFATYGKFGIEPDKGKGISFRPRKAAQIAIALFNLCSPGRSRPATAMRAPFLSAAQILATSVHPLNVAKSMIKSPYLAFHRLSRSPKPIEAAMIWPRRLDNHPRMRGCAALSPIRDTLNRWLQPLRYLRDCSDCFRLERLETDY